MRKLFLFALSALFSVSAFAAIKTETLVYKQGKTSCEGLVVYDDALSGKLPGVLVVHAWMGPTSYEKRRAEQLAGLGYVAFVADIYGKGVRAKNTEEAGKLSGIYKADRALMRARAQAALDTFVKNPHIDPAKIAAIGYCFGGTVALELARSGAPLGGVVSFHGGLNTPNLDDAKKIKGKILALHGGDDPYVPASEVTVFEQEMRDANVDWQIVKYGGAVHGFTHPYHGSDKKTGAAYDAKADQRSWDHMKTFFSEIFK